MDRPKHGGNLIWAALVSGAQIDSLLDFSASINPLGPPESALAAIQQRLSSLGTYPEPNYSQLKMALAKAHGLEPQWILPGNGSAELLTWASWELAQLQQTYLFTPAFADYQRALKTFHVRVVACPLSLDDKIVSIPSNILKRTNLHSSGIILNNPHNPTGKLWSLEELQPYLEEFAMVVMDEAFMDFVSPTEEQSLIPIIEKHPNLVILRSLTKFYTLAGLRLGYAIGHPERLQRWQQWRDPWPVNALAEAAGIAVIHDYSFQEKTHQWLSPARQELITGLNKLPGLKPLTGAANFLLVKTQKPGSQLQQELLQEHCILIRDCLSFNCLRDAYFRIAVRTRQENERLLQALATIWQY